MSFLNNGGLISVPCTGYRFTWCNNEEHFTRIYERLDSLVTNANWLTMYPYASLNNLPIHGSDHGPICLSLNNRSTSNKKNL